MKYVYFGLLLLLIVSALFCSGYKRAWIRSLDKKEHPFRLFYPLAARLSDLAEKLFPGNRSPKVRGMLKSLYVKENVDEEAKAYRVKKIATILSVIAGAALAGTLFCLGHIGADAVRTLSRNAPGEGEQSYDLQVEYQGKEEEIQISVEEEQYSREEILALLDSGIEGVRKEMLGENESAENVNKPLNLILQYGKIQIFWEIEDPEIVGYNGEIKTTPEGEDKQVLNLFATLSMNDVSKTYNVPVVITAPVLSEKENLVARIKEEISAMNDASDKEVQLPDTLDGKNISFREKTERNEAVILILSLLAAVVLAAGYDKRLENKVRKRKEEMMIDFTEIVSKMSLLYEAGSSILKAWEKIVADQEQKGEERFAYKEMKLALEKIKSGVRERDAYAQFGKRCGLNAYIKLGNILEQNLSKGTKGMKLLLKQETADAFEERKRLARKRGEEAGTKMLVPMVLMMVVVIVIVAVPAFMSIRL